MNAKNARFLIKTGINSLFKLGIKETYSLTKEYLRAKKRKVNFPLETAYVDYFFETNTEKTREKGKKIMRETSLIYDLSQIESTYPFFFEADGLKLRYAYLKSKEAPKGLIVLFHGHNAFLHAGPMEKLNNFDVLAPWDNFGLNRQGSWFWGEKGKNFVEKIVWKLIESKIKEGGFKRWFCFGGSMGGFAALYYGIKYGSDGVYALCPQIDLKQKILDYGMDNKNPYAHLIESSIEEAPDLLELARAASELPPLFLAQHQYDSVNSFEKHALKITEIYSRKKAWLGLRIQPAIGHIGEGTQKEAEFLFNLIVEKNPLKRVNFNF